MLQVNRQFLKKVAFALIAWLVIALLLIGSLSGCATTPPPQPPVIVPKPQPTPLPARVLSAETKPYTDWSATASAWSKKVECFLTPALATCSN